MTCNKVKFKLIFFEFQVVLVVILGQLFFDKKKNQKAFEFNHLAFHDKLAIGKNYY
ncbi:hypothetical protein FB1_02270 [Flavobacterium branchiophilum NBRC 15030 = ATCC 35035]|uniref:Uncharacterized protein n=1 Tax=Flavobacterium branchiophilum TaxID=55197 RepID=A0A543G2M2_9FLAO|nr:hypothetical protein BC670_1188 [Flavobacterium branchiophilum]GEM54006.1 hypothetical protein FB1_02270 [Flavobacterium branchiophilum NBRC 15030 = ATCC 35035]